MFATPTNAPLITSTKKFICPPICEILILYISLRMQ